MINAGRSNFLYYNDYPTMPPGTGTGTFASPSWVKIDRIGDLDRTFNKGSTEVNIRASADTFFVFGNKLREVNFTYYKRLGVNDPVFNVLLASFEDDLQLDLALAESDMMLAGTYYDRGSFIVGEMTKAEPIAGADSFEISLKPSDLFPYMSGATIPFLTVDSDGTTIDSGSVTVDAF